MPGHLQGMRVSQGLQRHPEPQTLTQESPKLCLFLGKPSQISILAPQVLWRQAWDCLLVSIVTGNREPPAAVWGYHRHQYLQVHTCPGNPWDGAGSSSCPCTRMPSHSTHIQGFGCMLRHKYTSTLAYADACTVTQALALGPSTNGTRDHPAGCDPVPQPPHPPWCGKGLGEEKIPFTTPTATQLTDHVLGIACAVSCSSHNTTG